MNDTITQTERTRLRRLPKRGTFDRETVYSILDEAFICHIGFAVDGQPYVIPTSFGRVEDTVHSRFVREPHAAYAVRRHRYVFHRDAH
jgi:Predicted flavin-nucleotide-binding protein